MFGLEAPSYDRPWRNLRGMNITTPVMIAVGSSAAAAGVEGGLANKDKVRGIRFETFH